MPRHIPHTPLKSPENAPRGTALVLGADGFLARFIIAALHRNGWHVLRGVRRPVRNEAERWLDFNQLDEAACTQALDGVDAVVNVAGILRQTRRQRFQTLHHDAPLRLARACVAQGAGCFVQISALGTAADGEFVASKHRFDDALLALPLRAVVLRPSVVFSTTGSYGGTSLLRAQAALPGVLPLPGHGRWLIQPVAAEEVAELVVRAVQSDIRGCFEIGSPQPMYLRDYLRQWRAWLGLPPAIELRVPLPLVSFGAWLGEHFGIGPLGQTTWRMLQHGNVTQPDAHVRVRHHFGIAPAALEPALSARPSQVQDRWHAQLHGLQPLLRWTLIALFALSAWSGFATPAEHIQALAAGSPLAGFWPVELARIAAACDAALALALLRTARSRMVLSAMFVLVFLYTLVFGIFVPGLWLDPLGGLAKNLVVLPAIAVLWVLSDRR